MLDPYLILGVSRETTDDEVRKAYLIAIRNCPPEQDSVRFQRAQRAYDTIKTQRLRLKHGLFNHEPPTAEDLLAQAAKQFTTRCARPDIATFQALLRRCAE